MPGVATAAGVLESATEINGTSQPLTLLGIDSQDLSLDDVQVTNGTAFTNSTQIILGTTAATGLNKTIGDEIGIDNQTFTVVGIYETGDYMSDRGAIISLSTLQNLTNTTGVSQNPRKSE